MVRGSDLQHGFTAGLEAWRPLLKPDGRIAVSEITWLGETRPATLTEFWEAEYPEITTLVGNVAKLEDAGFQLIGYFPLPVKAWTDHYYSPLEHRLDAFLSRHGHSACAQSIAADTRSEIGLYQQHSLHFSYGFYIARVI